eukprot:m.415651 g.415651  ORF g.415651 m.415651 type:complete len:299 (+) comp29707_c0_seq1:240-1136(+)
MWSARLLRAGATVSWPQAAARAGRSLRPQPLLRSVGTSASHVEAIQTRVTELRARDAELATSIEKLTADLEAAEAERAQVEVIVAADELKLRNARGSTAWNEKVLRALKSPESLVINIFARSRRGLLHDICGVLLRCDLSLKNSQWTASGGQMSIMLMVTKQDGLDQADADAVEASLKELQVEDGDFVCKVLPSVPWTTKRPTVVAEVVGLDRPGIAATVVSMLEDANIEITSLDTRVESQPQEGAQMFRLKMGLSLDTTSTVNSHFKTIDDQMEELDRLVHEIEKKLDHDIQMIIED